MINLVLTVALTATAPLSHPGSLTGMAPELAGVSTTDVNDGWLEIRTTAYTHSESDHLVYGRKNACGTILKYGKVRSAAADWSKFPVGTKFRIKGDPNLYQVDDYGGALVGKNTIDIYKPSKSSMNNWGLRRVEIQIVEWGCFKRSLKIMGPRVGSSHVRKMVESIENRG